MSDPEITNLLIKGMDEIKGQIESLHNLLSDKYVTKEAHDATKARVQILERALWSTIGVITLTVFTALMALVVKSV